MITYQITKVPTETDHDDKISQIKQEIYNSFQNLSAIDDENRDENHINNTPKFKEREFANGMVGSFQNNTSLRINDKNLRYDQNNDSINNSFRDHELDRRLDNQAI